MAMEYKIYKYILLMNSINILYVLTFIIITQGII